MAQLENFRLKVFRAVAEHLNFRKAAEHLFLSQPAVTLQIKSLENDLGVRLFDRGPKGVSLTPKGAKLLRYARKIGALAAEAERDVGAEDGAFSGELALGVSTTIAQYVLPRLIGAFLDEHPRVELSLQSGNTEHIARLLAEKSISIGLIEGPARERGVHAEPFMKDELVLIVPPGFEWGHVSAEQFLDSNLLMREQGSGSRRVIETALDRAGFVLKSFRKVIHLDSTESIKSAVEARLGVGFVSRWAIAKELELGSLKVAEIRGLRIVRHFSLITRTGPEPHGLSGAFRQFALARGAMLPSKIRR